MGNAHSSGTFFHDARLKEHFVAIQRLWIDEDLERLVARLKDMTLNFSLDRVKFARLLQLAASYETLIAQWFADFSHDRASQVVDGLEFLAGAILLSSQVPLSRKVGLLFSLFDLDRTGCVRKDEFTILLKAVTTGVHRMVEGLPPPATVMELGALSTEFFSTLSSEVLSPQDLLMWMTEAHFSLHYLSVFSKLGTAIFAWGANQRHQLGLEQQLGLQKVPVPVLCLEGLNVRAVATNESHSLFLTHEGRVWSCGSGFCGILGHGDLKDSPAARQIDALSHVRVVDVAVGVRHSVAVSDKGQVFTWGNGDLGQLGHGPIEDKEVYETAFDPKTGGSFVYVTKPTVVMALFGKKVVASRASCCNFTTAVMTAEGRIHSWGNNTDGQAGQGQRCPGHKLVHIDQHLHRTAMQAIFTPRQLECDMRFKSICCGGYHVLAIDAFDRLWTWGQGLSGKLGHGDQRSMYEPKLVEALQYQSCQGVAAGESHSFCLCSLFRLTVTGSSSVPLAPFSLLALPCGRVDTYIRERTLTTPPGTNLQLNAFVCGRLLQIGLPFRFDPNGMLVDPEKYTKADIQDSVVLIDRGLCEGEWLKLATTDFDFHVMISSSGAPISSKTGLSSKIVFAGDGKWEADDCQGQICVFELRDGVSGAQIAANVVEVALECQRGRGLACLCVLPKKVDKFDVVATPDAAAQSLRSFTFGVMSYEHGQALKKHVARLVSIKVSQATDGQVEEMRDWLERREEFTGRPFYENSKTGRKRWAPPVIVPNTEAALLVMREDYFLQRLKGILNLRPRGLIVCQQSYRPDVELVTLPSPMFNLDHPLPSPIALVTYEAGEELKSVAANGSEPYITMEIQASGGLYAWGHGTNGQLGLTGIENQQLLASQLNQLTGMSTLHATRPCYVAHLHEHQVVEVACGISHTAAVTQQGEVFAWGSAEGLGVPLAPPTKPQSDVPIFVEQLEGLVRAKKVYAGGHHTIVAAEMPFKSIL